MRHKWEDLGGEEQKALVRAFLEVIALDPQAFRAALELRTDEDIKEEDYYQDEFTRWRSSRRRKYNKDVQS